MSPIPAKRWLSERRKEAERDGDRSLLFACPINACYSLAIEHPLHPRPKKTLPHWIFEPVNTNLVVAITTCSVALSELFTLSDF